ncbi:hypothetical protein EVAR_37459_1 [Eumeta japonica]|uniref:Uncharacterized protein n=1 Tax=Eumeta variegata TaxID=151549 RepID=A0A4C1X6P1_EUMVA|nr:hypothetical protein EVAR_37459_1 [Eumeta japonica]
MLATLIKGRRPRFFSVSQIIYLAGGRQFISEKANFASDGRARWLAHAVIQQIARPPRFMVAPVDGAPPAARARRPRPPAIVPLAAPPACPNGHFTPNALLMFPIPLSLLQDSIKELEKSILNSNGF